MLFKEAVELPVRHLTERELEARITALEREVAFYCRKEKAMRDALVKARATIVILQTAGQGGCKQQKASKLSWPLRGIGGLRGSQKSAERASSIYVSRSRLEEAILHQARFYARGVESVVVEFVQLPTGSAEPNWRVLGIANGKLEGEVASRAVEEAARYFASYVMVADNSPLDGRLVGAQPRKDIEALRRKGGFTQAP